MNKFKHQYNDNPGKKNYYISYKNCQKELQVAIQEEIDLPKKSQNN